MVAVVVISQVAQEVEVLVVEVQEGLILLLGQVELTLLEEVAVVLVLK